MPTNHTARRLGIAGGLIACLALHGCPNLGAVSGPGGNNASPRPSGPSPALAGSTGSAATPAAPVRVAPPPLQPASGDATCEGAWALHAPQVPQAPLDLAGLTWVPTDSRAFTVGDRRIAANGNPSGEHYLLYNRPLGPAFTLRFTEVRPAATEPLSIHWLYEPEYNTTSFHGLHLAPSGAAEVRTGQDVNAKVAGSAARRRWEIRVKDGVSEVLADGKEVARLTRPAGTQPVPFIYLHWKAGQAGRTALLEDVEVEAPGATERAVGITQWAMPPADHADRLTLVVRQRHAAKVDLQRASLLPAIFESLQRVAGYQLDWTDPVVAEWDKIDGFNSGWAFAPTTGMGPDYVVSHEMGHWYGVAGGQPHPGNAPWLVEGFVTFLGNQARNLVVGRPRWHDLLLGNEVHPRQATWRLGGWNDPPLGLAEGEVGAEFGGRSAYTQAGYDKAYAFWQVLAATTSYEDVTKVIVANKGKIVKTDDVITALARVSGKDLSRLRAGWLERGAYSGVSPAHVKDTDDDGLPDHQELPWGLDPESADTDKDGVSDYHELASGADPRRAGTPAPGRWHFDGLPGDFLACGGTAVANGGGGNAVGTWRQLAVRRRGQVLEGAAWMAQDAAQDTRYKAYTLIVHDPAGGRRLKVDFIGAFVGPQWLDNAAGPALDATAFHARVSSEGMEFVLPGNLFPPGTRTNWQVRRGGDLGSGWQDTAMEVEVLMP